MDIEFHYYLTFVIARFAGLNNESARIIAYSSQYVDDNLNEYRIICPYTGQEYLNAASATYSPIVGQNEIKILLCHHFLPGDYQDALIVSPDSVFAQRFLSAAIESENLYLIGIAVHAYADTWAHQDFKGLNHVYNDSGTLFGSVIPSIGHADFGSLPDMVGIHWFDGRFKKQINNNIRFREAGLRVYDYLARLSKNQGSVKERKGLSCFLKGVLKKAEAYSFLSHELKKRKRIQKYQRYNALHDSCDLPYYDHKEWFNQAVVKEGSNYFWLPGYKSSHWYQFQEAVKLWQHLGVKAMNILQIKKETLAGSTFKKQ